MECVNIVWLQKLNFQYDFHFLKYRHKYLMVALETAIWDKKIPLSKSNFIPNGVMSTKVHWHHQLKNQFKFRISYLGCMDFCKKVNK